MINKNKRLVAPKKGVGIIEALVAVTVFTLGLVGVSKLMAVSLKSTQNSEMQGRVALLVTDAMERIRILGTSVGPAAKNAFLDNSSCTGLVGADLEQCTLGKQSRSEWDLQVDNTLGTSAIESICRRSAVNSITCSANNSSDSIIIVINWSEKLIGKGKQGDTAISAKYTTTADF